MSTTNFTVDDLNNVLSEALMGVEHDPNKDGLYLAATIHASDSGVPEQVSIDTTGVDYMLGHDARDPRVQRALLDERQSCITIGSMASWHADAITSVPERPQHVLFIPAISVVLGRSIVRQEIDTVVSLLGRDARADVPVLYVPSQRRVVLEPHTCPFLTGVFKSAQSHLNGR